MKLIFTIIMILMASNLFALYIPILYHSNPSAPTYPNPQQRSGACIAPINFSIEHRCSITYAGSYSINDYRCGDYLIKGDCNGGTINVIDNSTINSNPIHSIILLLLGFLSFGLILTFFR